MFIIFLIFTSLFCKLDFESGFFSINVLGNEMYYLENNGKTVRLVKKEDDPQNSNEKGVIHFDKVNSQYYIIFSDGKILGRKESDPGIIAYENKGKEQEHKYIKWDIKIKNNGGYRIKTDKYCLTNTGNEDVNKVKGIYLNGWECKKENNDKQEWTIRRLKFNDEKVISKNEDKLSMHEKSTDSLDRPLKLTSNYPEPFKYSESKEIDNNNSIIGNNTSFYDGSSESIIIEE